MRVLYAIQGTGNGHICRAQDVVPILDKKVDLDILISGIQVDIDLPKKVKYKFKGLSFIFGKKGGVSLYETWKKNKILRFLHEVKSLPVEEYDLVISDFEPVSTWACQLKGVPCIGLSHQAAVLAKKAPKPSYKDPLGKNILKYYAPTSWSLGFHFERFNKKTYTPIIRSSIRNKELTTKGHYTVYLPAYTNEKLFKVLSKVPEVEWQVFSKHSAKTYKEGNVSFMPIDNEAFVQSFSSCEGILCGAGFETPAEALFMGKKLMVIPMKSQYEQHCNAAAIKTLGVPVLDKLKLSRVGVIKEWISSKEKIKVNYPDETEQIIDFLLEKSKEVTFKSYKTQLTEIFGDRFNI